MPQDQEPPAAPHTGDFEILDAPPGERLAGIVTRITGYRETGTSGLRQQQPASLIIPLIVSFGEPFSIGLGREPTSNDRFGSFAAGLFAGPVIIHSRGASHCIQIDFTPLGARRFFRLPMHELADRMVPLDEILGREGEAMRESLGNEPDWATRFDLARRFVGARIAGADAPGEEISAAFHGIERSGGRIRITRLAERVGWSRKHLANRFRDEIGLGPKSISRIVRINRAIAMSRGSREGLAGIADACGFADQAHLTREVQALAGMSLAAASARVS